MVGKKYLQVVKFLVLRDDVAGGHILACELLKMRLARDVP